MGGNSMPQVHLITTVTLALNDVNSIKWQCSYLRYYGFIFVQCQEEQTWQPSLFKISFCFVVFLVHNLYNVVCDLFFTLAVLSVLPTILQMKIFYSSCVSRAEQTLILNVAASHPQTSFINVNEFALRNLSLALIVMKMICSDLDIHFLPKEH